MTFFYLLFTVYDIFEVLTVVTSDNIVKSNFVEILILYFVLYKGTNIKLFQIFFIVLVNTIH